MIPVLGIPYYNRSDLLRRCIESIDYPIKHLVIVDNSVEQLIGRDIEIKCDARHVTKLTIIQHPNAGVAGSWNEIIKLFPAYWWMLVNNDIQFAPGDLERLALAVEEASPERMPWHTPVAFFGNHGASWWVVTSRGIDRVGLFDENFHPAYLEDCDWSYRAKQTGAEVTNVQGCSSIHGYGAVTGSCTIMSDAVARKKNGDTHGRNFAYYQAKWGGINGKEKFTRPFNDPHADLRLWRFNPSFRMLQQW